MSAIESVFIKVGYDVLKSFVLSLLGNKKEQNSKKLNDFKIIDDRITVNSKAKSKIAKAVVNKIINKSFDLKFNPILLDTGSLTYYIGLELMKGSDANIVTNNLTIVFEGRKKEHPTSIEILFGEKQFDEKQFAFVGTAVAKEAEKLLKKGLNNISRAKVAVLGLRAYSHQKGIFENTAELTDFQASLLEHSENLIIVAQGEKFLCPIVHPILEINKFKKIMEKRKKEKTVWFVYHEPKYKLTKDQRAYYKGNLTNFLELIPIENVINTTKN